VNYAFRNAEQVRCHIHRFLFHGKSLGSSLPQGAGRDVPEHQVEVPCTVPPAGRLTRGFFFRASSWLRLCRFGMHGHSTCCMRQAQLGSGGLGTIGYLSNKKKSQSTLQFGGPSQASAHLLHYNLACQPDLFMGMSGQSTVMTLWKRRPSDHPC
jgi:hypothetical protein